MNSAIMRKLAGIAALILVLLLFASSKVDFVYQGF